MKSLVGAFLAITAINSAPGLPAGMATCLTVLAALVATIVYFLARRRRRRATAVCAPVAPAPPAAGPTIIQHIYTTQPVFTGGHHPGQSASQPVYVHSERVREQEAQVILSDSIYHQPAK